MFQRYDAQSNKWLLVTSMATRRSSVKPLSSPSSSQAGLQPAGLRWIILRVNFGTIRFLSHTHTAPIVCKLVLNTFKRSNAERVPSECSQPRYTCDISEYLFKSTAERVPSECSKPRYTCDIFLLILYNVQCTCCPHIKHHSGSRIILEE